MLLFVLDKPRKRGNENVSDDAAEVRVTLIARVCYTLQLILYRI